MNRLQKKKLQKIIKIFSRKYLYSKFNEVCFSYNHG